jgi:hypothetical protein
MEGMHVVENRGSRASYLLNKLVEEGFLRREKGKCWARYLLVYASADELGLGS